MKNCPKCGVDVKAGAVECFGCGVIFERYFAIQKAKAEKGTKNQEQEAVLKARRELEEKVSVQDAALKAQQEEELKAQRKEEAIKRAEEERLRAEKDRLRYEAELEQQRVHQERIEKEEDDRHQELFKKLIPQKVYEATARYSDFGANVVVGLKVVAWLNLAGGILLAIIYSSSDLGAVGSFLSVFWGVSGAVTCVFLLVLCSIAENLIAIRKNTAFLVASGTVVTAEQVKA